MKFSWKICISSILISLAVFSIGGYGLISALFQFTYEREVANAAEENRMMQYSFAAYWNISVEEQTLNRENVQKTVQAMLGGMSEHRVDLRILDSQNNPLFDNTKIETASDLAASVRTDTRGHVLKKDGESYSLFTASMIRMVDGQEMYLETVRDVTSIFGERDRQYRIYRQWMLVVLLVESLCFFVMTVWLLRPLRKLTGTTKSIANGNLNVRVRIKSKDEFGELALAFNDMADNLEQQFHELEDAARRQEDFIASFAHELKTPLTSMIGYADMLRTRQMGQEQQFEAANHIFKEGKRLEGLSLKLLELLVVRNGELERKVVSAKWLAEDVQGVLLPPFQKQGIVFCVDVEDEMILAEPDLMKTVLLNLLDNGRKAMEEGGTLSLKGCKEEAGFSFYIEDTGKGMPEEEIAKITEAFYMVDKSRSRRQGGAGLGLSICTEIIHRHGGEMMIQSEEGKGTLVKLYLPEVVS